MTHSSIETAGTATGRWAEFTASARSFGRGVRFIARLVVEASSRLAAALLLLTLVQAALPVMNVWLTKRIVNNLVAGLGAASLAAPLAVYLSLHVAGAGLAPALQAVQALLNERLMGQVSLLALSRVNQFSDLSPFEDPARHDDMRTLIEYGSYIPRQLLRHGTDLLQNTLSAVGLCLLLASLHPFVPLVLLAVTLPGFLVQRRQARLRRDEAIESAELERRMDYWVEIGTSAGCARDVQSFGISDWICDQFRHCHEALDHNRWQVRRRLLAQCFATFVVRFGGTAAVLGYLIARGVAGEVKAGDFVLFFGSLLMLDGLLHPIPWSIGHIITQGYMTGRFLAFLQPEAGRSGPNATLPAEAVRQGVSLRNVSFRYPGREETVLEDISFAIHPGETVAVVGKNGAGKTTLVKLLTGLYHPTGGSLRCGDRELSDCDPASVRASIAVVFQDFCRYFLTAGDNIGLGRVESMADRERVARAARDGGSEALIQRLDDGYDTRLGKEFGGTQLSGGEWQRLALSRAFMRDAELLILDEPTAALDVRTEAEIYQRFRALLGGRMGLLISHRFSTVRMADRILVLDEGRIVEDGTHDELLLRDGLYAQMFYLQAAAYHVAGEAAS